MLESETESRRSKQIGIGTGIVISDFGTGIESEPESEFSKGTGITLGWIRIRVDLDSRQSDSDPDSRCPDSHITGWSIIPGSLRARGIRPPF